MSLVKGSIIVGGSSLQTYAKDGNNLHSEFVEEWIVIEDQNLAININHYWRLRDKETSIRLVSLWASTTNNIVFKIANQGIDILNLTISSAQASAGFVFPVLVLPAKYDIVIVPSAAIARLFLFAKQVAIAENFSLARQ
jgi:hypothetical protein